MSVASASDREFRFDDEHFEVIKTLVREAAGIELSTAKRELAYGRLARRLRALGLDDFDQYCALLRSEGSPERVECINAITTNFTSFFREGHHFEFLREEAIPELMRRRGSTRRLRIWSAACSTGQEPYSIAITASRALPTTPTWDWKILATDIDRNVVDTATAGVYSSTEVADIEAAGERGRWFEPVSPGDPTRVRATEQLRELIYFRVLNLMETWPMQGPMDVIFCRNVLIYFSAETQRRLIERFADLLAPDGYLFIGHSESILHSGDLFESLGRTIYRRAGAGR